jgi:GH15 family glucan-1,4-alpha-glucosidase
MKIEDYGLIGDLQTAALVGRDGSVDWLCLPRFDSASVFAALLGDQQHGRWLLGPTDRAHALSRRYRPGTLVLETDFETTDGVVRLIDFMPQRGEQAPQLVRIVEGLQGRVAMRMMLCPRPDYAAIVPWVELVPDGATAVAGPDAFRLSTGVALEVADGVITATFVAIEGARQRFVLSWCSAFAQPSRVEDADSALARTETWWHEWSGRCTYGGEYREAVLRSLITLKALTNESTGAIIAAPTTSLPEDVGGVRNWDYRYCWLRDSAATLAALTAGGYTEEALAFRAYMMRVATGDPSKLQIMYGVGGERRLTEFELNELPGYEGSRPVRIGNAASDQFQLDVYGELAIASHLSLELLGRSEIRGWERWLHVVDHVANVWHEPDDGIWEARAPRRHYTFSKVMAWAVFDRSLRLVERTGLDAPVGRWRRIRDEIHAEVCARGYDPQRETFTQYYGSPELDASVLVIPLIGFLPPEDERVQGTIAAVMLELSRDGLLSRYSTDETDDGLPGDEGQFLACSFWLVGALAISNRLAEARALFDRLLSLRNDLGLLAEEYDVSRGRQVGNFPQALSHLALIGAARAISLAQQTARSSAVMSPG